MSLGNAAEQLEAALVESMIRGECERLNGTEVSRTQTVGENGELYIDITIGVSDKIEYTRVIAKIL